VSGVTSLNRFLELYIFLATLSEFQSRLPSIASGPIFTTNHVRIS